MMTSDKGWRNLTFWQDIPRDDAPEIQNISRQLFSRPAFSSLKASASQLSDSL